MRVPSTEKAMFLFENTRRLAFLLASAIALIGMGCGEEPPPGPPPKAEFGLEVSAVDTDDQPMARVPVKVDDKIVGYTDKDGVFRATITERPGTELTLGVGDLDGYRWLTEATSITESLRQNSSGIGIPMALQVQAESRKREYLVWMKIECDDTLDDGACKDRPVSLNGEDVAKTDEFGYAHFTFSAVPQDKALVKIGTPKMSAEDKVLFMPENPEFEVTLGLESHVYLIEESFSNGFQEEKKPRSKRRRSTSRRKASTKRKTTRKTTKKKKKKDKKEEAIDLW